MTTIRKEAAEAAEPSTFDKKLQDASVRVGVTAGLFVIFAGILYAAGAPGWAYFVAALCAAVLSK